MPASNPMRTVHTGDGTGPNAGNEVDMDIHDVEGSIATLNAANDNDEVLALWRSSTASLSTHTVDELNRILRGAERVILRACLAETRRIRGITPPIVLEEDIADIKSALIR